jgi:hypothetical protein
MADPFLLAHQVAESVFDIGGKLYPVSIRDQMVRGQAIIDRAVAEGFAATGRELLVIGAGAAGAVAAMRAADWGIRTHLIEADSHPFGRQRSCRTRWIDAHEYEWPAGHWPRRFYPYDSPPLHPYYGYPVPLPWQVQWADALAFGWSTRFATARATHPHLTFYPNTTLAPAGLPTYGAATGIWAVDLSNGTPLQVGMILNAVGFSMARAEHYWDRSLQSGPGEVRITLILSGWPGRQPAIRKGGQPMSATSTCFQSEKAPCGRLIDGEHYQEQDDESLVTDNWYYACGCRSIRHEYHDGSICLKVVRHDGAILVDELFAEH